MSSSKLTEREAWLALAGAIDLSCQNEYGYFYVSDVLVFGLCEALRRLNARRTISNSTYLDMAEKIRKNQVEKLGSPHGFLWPVSVAGRADRKAFCLAQAREGV